MFETSSDSPAPVRVVTEAVKEYIDRLGPIWIEGEISELNERSGTMAFIRLRDLTEDMSLSIMCHKSVIAAIKPVPANARVVVYAKPSWYVKNGSLSFSVREIRQVGVGELLARLEALKNALALEGLFNADRKVALPRLPHTIGLICGRNTDAEKDVVENAKRRWPNVQFEIREVTVQGANAVSEVSAALRELEELDSVDVIIITRGGGSFEDLLPFSDESLVRLAASCQTPIVSAIGHEKDSPLLDLVADYRASTPTDAAKKVVPDVNEELEAIALIRDRMFRRVSASLDFERSTIDNLRQRLSRSLEMWVDAERRELSQIRARVRALSPQSTMDRGYSVVQTPDGSVVRDAREITSGQRLRLRFASGETSATAD